MKQLDVKIMGQSYLMACPDGGELQFREAVQRVDAAMCRIRDAGKVKARDRIAVLAALNLAFELSEIPQARTAGANSTGQLVGTASPDAEVPSAALGSLLQRLDAALGDDGRLL